MSTLPDPRAPLRTAALVAALGALSGCAQIEEQVGDAVRETHETLGEIIELADEAESDSNADQLYAPPAGFRSSYAPPWARPLRPRSTR